MTPPPRRAAPILDPTAETREREKRTVAIRSLFAALGLTASKLGVGLATGSLGILSEAAHSGLDLVATGMTYWAVRAASQPPDRRHTYGHGKYENISALGQTILLLATCAWIVVEAVKRLRDAEPALVDANVWAFLVILGSIAVDLWRSRALKRAAVTHRSQALEADALHFSTDIWSSLVVLLGLVGVVLAEHWQLSWLHRADPVAALAVAFIVLVVSLRMGKKSLDDLLDATPDDLPDTVARAARVAGVREVSHVRVRRSGPRMFTDIRIIVDPLEGIGRAHEIADAAEASVKAVLDGGDVTVHVEPDTIAGAPAATVAHQLATRRGLNPHDVRVYDEGTALVVELHLETDPNLTLNDAHAAVTAFETALHEALPRLRRVITHIEPSGSRTRPVPASRGDTEPIRRALGALPEATGITCEPYGVEVFRTGKRLSVGLCFSVDPATSLAEAHDISTRIEQFLRTQLPEVKHVVVHVEPSSAAPSEAGDSKAARGPGTRTSAQADEAGWNRPCHKETPSS